ncbi:DUF3846 domain-containing protein [Bifidobacterium callitrichidarum]|nr:DUF3846 domain-containing protein [Bifidobacterium callitrichidarum]
MMDNADRMLRAVICRPGENATVENIDNSLASLQQLVEGYIEVIPLDPGIVAICNEEGSFRGKPCRIIREFGVNRAVVFGTFIIVASDPTHAGFRSLSEEQTMEYSDRFHDAEFITKVNGRIHAVGYDASGESLFKALS